MRVAVVHDWLVNRGGAELVLGRILRLYPQADVYTVVEFLKDEDRWLLNGCRIYTTFIQRLPFARKMYQNYLPLMPFAIEQLDLSRYDLIISSSHAVAKGVITGPDQIHVSYVYSPVRYAWDLQGVYLKEAKLDKGLRGLIARLILHYLRLWDCRTGASPDVLIAVSSYIARRIDKTYRRPAEVIYPPVRLKEFFPGAKRGDFYLTASRLVPYKMVPMIAEAFSRMPDKRLIIVGDGPEAAKVRAAARSNVEYLGHQPQGVLLDLMQRARAFVFAAEEDLGVTLLETQACGTPVIAFGKGGALETVVDKVTGVFFDEQTPEALINAVGRFERIEKTFDPSRIRRHVEQFGEEVFDKKLKACIDRATQNQRLSLAA